MKCGKKKLTSHTLESNSEHVDQINCNKGNLNGTLLLI